MTDQKRPRPKWATLTMDSTREEVLAAVEEADPVSAESKAMLAKQSDDDIDWRGDPPAKRRGCYWAKDGSYSVHMGRPPRADCARARQDRAGEEDQSQPGWDSLP